MIVIATNKGRHCISECIQSARTFNPSDRIAVVDTVSNDPEYIDLTKKLCYEFSCDHLVCPEPRYDFGAYLHAIEMFPDAPDYFFQHDSVIFKRDDSLSKLREKSGKNRVCAWTTFDQRICPFDDEGQRQWIVGGFGTDVYVHGIYGPNFFIQRDTINRVVQSWNLKDIVVDTKKKQQAMERAWPIVFRDCGIELVALEETDPTNFNMKYHTNSFDYFKKICNNTRQ